MATGVRAAVSITELCRRHGCTPRALRFYEDLGLVRGARGQLNRRCYDADAQARIALIVELRRAGLSLENIGHVLACRDADGAPACARLVGTLLSARLALLDAERREVKAAIQRFSTSSYLA